MNLISFKSTNKMKRQLKFLKLILFLISSSYFILSIRVSKNITNNDFEILKLLNLDKECINLDSYKKEINCINTIQKSQLKLIEGKKCRGKFINLGSKEVIYKNTGCCNDRSRITEQLLQIYGFKVRHIHLNHTSNLGYFNLLIPGTPSHASTEVLTSKGWIGVDSNEPFLLNNNNQPNTYKEAISNGLIHNLTDNDFYKKSVTYIIGLYSRNGTFFEPYLPFIPEINIVDFFSNLKDIKIINPYVKN